MKALIIYESMYGNTHSIATAIGDGINAQSWTVEVVEVGTAQTTIASEVDLLVGGAPTHQFGLSRPSSRELAAREAKPLVSRRTGVRDWTDEVRMGRPGLTAATFDTTLMPEVL